MSEATLSPIAESRNLLAADRFATRGFCARVGEGYLHFTERADDLPAVAAHHDQPFGNGSAVPAYDRAKVARDDGVSHRLAGVEVAYPLLDQTQPDFSLTRPTEYKLKGLKAFSAASLQSLAGRGVVQPGFVGTLLKKHLPAHLGYCGKMVYTGSGVRS